MNSSIGHRPSAPAWQFDQTVADCFTDMLERSVPGYALMRDISTRLARRALFDGAHALDIGSSLGDGIVKIAKGGPDVTYTLVEPSHPMREGLASRMASLGSAAPKHRIFQRLDEAAGSYDLVTCVLTAQFMPIHERKRMLERVYAMLNGDSPLIIVEKVLCESPDVDELFIAEHHAMKHEAGYSLAEIEEKRKALQYVMAPLDARVNEGMLRFAGFESVECFWRCLNFAGWIAYRGNAKTNKKNKLAIGDGYY